VDLLHLKVELQDIFFRVRNKIRRVIANKKEFNSTQGRSDSQESFYLEQINRILTNNKSLRNFRRKYDYREILEHVSYNLGKEYFQRIKIQTKENYETLIENNLKNDSFGNPYKYRYEGGLVLSPTTLRYIHTALDIERTVNLTSSDSIAEIGIGYGGQAAVIERLFKVDKYYAFDLPEVINLANIFLSEIGSNVCFMNDLMVRNPQKHWDVVISNYAFSELHKDLQTQYLENVLSKASRGYMIMNSGRTNNSGRSNGKLSLDMICEYLPSAKVKEEIPLTGPDNYVLYWGS
jgi:putative sugar O-methyltransferase